LIAGVVETADVYDKMAHNGRAVGVVRIINLKFNYENDRNKTKVG
jgi:hypothetical protein